MARTMRQARRTQDNEYKQTNGCCSTWIGSEDAARFRAIAAAHGVTPAALLRAIIIDAIADEEALLSRPQGVYSDEDRVAV